SPERELNLDLPVLGSLPQHETSTSSNYASEFCVIHLCQLMYTLHRWTRGIDTGLTWSSWLVMERLGFMSQLGLLRVMYPDLRGERMENHSGKTTLISLDRDSNLNLPVIGSPVHWESRALDHTAIEALIPPIHSQMRPSGLRAGTDWFPEHPIPLPVIQVGQTLILHNTERDRRHWPCHTIITTNRGGFVREEEW
ncbi:unnamed protein product, partial [Timema podura]|nr:unnamed protein product [Timema podura]